jgi:hypothetical protein
VASDEKRLVARVYGKSMNVARARIGSHRGRFTTGDELQDKGNDPDACCNDDEGRNRGPGAYRPSDHPVIMPQRRQPGRQTTLPRSAYRN